MKGPGGPGPRGMGTPEQPGKLLGRLARYIFKNYSIHIVIVVICIFVSVLANVQGTMFMKTLIDQYITPLLCFSQQIHRISGLWLQPSHVWHAFTPLVLLPPILITVS